MSKESVYNSKLRKIREEKGFSLEELAAATGVTAMRIRHYETGFRSINRAAALLVSKIAKVLDCSVDDILDSEGEVYVNTDSMST